jgi:hypothetical protein
MAPAHRCHEPGDIVEDLDGIRERPEPAGTQNLLEH